MINWVLRTPARLELARRFSQHSGNEDDWEYQYTKYSPFFFGYSSEKKMGTYLEGNSRIEIKHPGEIDEFLDSCQYTEHETNTSWLHPLELEQSKNGSCMGFSLWAWRKLIELGEDVCLVVGKKNDSQQEHAWIMHDNDTGSTLIETVQRNGRCHPLGDVKSDYTPFFGVEGNLTNRIYSGYLNKQRRDFNL